MQAGRQARRLYLPEISLVVFLLAVTGGTTFTHLPPNTLAHTHAHAYNRSCHPPPPPPPPTHTLAHTQSSTTAHACMHRSHHSLFSALQPDLNPPFYQSQGPYRGLPRTLWPPPTQVRDWSGSNTPAPPQPFALALLARNTPSLTPTSSCLNLPPQCSSCLGSFSSWAFSASQQGLLLCPLWSSACLPDKDKALCPRPCSAVENSAWHLGALRKKYLLKE